MKKKAVGKIVLYGFGGLLVFIGIAAGFIYANQDRIIQLFVNEANKHIKTKVAVQKISLSLFDKFPQAAITLHNISVTENVAGSTAPLIRAKRLYFTFNIPDILANRYQVREVFLEEGQVFVKLLPDGTANYHIFSPDSSRAANTGFAFQINKITLQNIALHYADQRRQLFFEAEAHRVQAALAVHNHNIAVVSNGNAWVKTIRIEGDQYFQEKEIALQTQLKINRLSGQVQIMPSVVSVGPARYQLAGMVQYTGPTRLDLHFTGKNTTIQSLLALVPAKFSEPFGQYRSQGQVYFNGTVKGVTSGKENPQVLVQFGCRNASFYHPGSEQKLAGLNLQGQFSNGKNQNNFTSVIELKNIRGRIKNKPFSGSISVRNLQDPFLAVKVKADLDVGHALQVFPVTSLAGGSGEAAIDIAFSGKMRAFKTHAGYGQITSSGEINLKNVSLQVKNYPPPFRQLTGNFIFRKSDLAVSDFTGKLGSSDFLLNGYFKNVLGWLFLSKQRLLVEADIQSDVINLNELLSENRVNQSAGNAGSKRFKKNAPAYKLVVSPYFDFDINAKVRRLQFRRFNGKNMHGTIRLKNQVLSSPLLALDIIGGQFAVRGILDARQANTIKVTTLTTLNDIRLDSLFYVFENFGQQFLVQRHLRGELTAAINSDLYFNSHLKPQTNRLEAEVDARIRNGQLINFEPMQKLSPFIDKQELVNLRFSELSNKFWIQERTVYIPEMEVRSSVANVSVIGIQGTHTFDQQLEYKFRIPLRNKIRRAGIPPAGLAESSGPNLFLILKGSENNYKIAYDQQRVKNKIKQDLHREKQEFKQVLKGTKPAEKKKPAQPQPSENEYFDF